jgi:hypothetical protein
MSPENEDLKRVTTNIKGAIIGFCRARLHYKRPRFTMGEMAAFVAEYPGVSVSPDSTSRVFRMLRKAGRVDYLVVDRSRSLYELRSVS